MAHIMEPDIWQTRSPGQPIKFFTKIIAILRGTIQRWEDKIIFFPDITVAGLSKLARQINNRDLRSQRINKTRPYCKSTAPSSSFRGLKFPPTSRELR